MITENNVLIHVENLHKCFGSLKVLSGIDIDICKGDVVVVVGPSGSGKSTFLRILSGDLEPTSGEVIISKDQRMSILKQDHFQYDAYTVLDTVIMGNQRLYDIMKEKDALYEKEDNMGVIMAEADAEHLFLWLKDLSEAYKYFL